MIPRKVLDLAIREALKSNHRFRLGAVVFYGTKILASGFNKVCTHPKSPHPYKTIHAEFSALNKLEGTNLRRASIYVHRLMSKGEPGLAKPCLYCEGYIRSKGVEGIYFSR